MLEIFKSDLFWAAFGALIAFATLFGSIAGAAIALLKTAKQKKLQEVLDRERKFYEEQARRVTPELMELPEESAIERYLKSIEDGLLAIAQLPDEKRDRTKDKIRELISQLKATHVTLVDSMKLFTTNNAKTFFEEFDQLNQNFGALYHSGTIPHGARTHCGDVVGIVNEIASRLESESSESSSESTYKIREIAYSMEYADQEIIVPIMMYLLSKTEVELSLINAAIREGEKHKAIWLKERYRFDIEKLYKRLSDSLLKMSELASKL